MESALVFGRGYIGSTLSSYLECPSADDLLYTYEDIQAQIDEFKPKTIINCLGIKAKTVDDCDKDITSTIRMYSVMPIFLAEAAIRNKIKLVHISSGSIFTENDSIEEYSEDDVPDYLSQFYSRSKIYSEQVLSILSDVLVLRVMHPISYIPHPRNILTRLLEMTKVTDTAVSVTYMPDFLLAVKHLLKHGATGIYNVVNKGPIRYSTILEEYRKFNVNHHYAIMDSREMPGQRTHVVLSSAKLESTGFKVRSVEDILPECMSKYVDYIRSTNEEALPEDLYKESD